MLARPRSYCLDAEVPPSPHARWRATGAGAREVSLLGSLTREALCACRRVCARLLGDLRGPAHGRGLVGPDVWSDAELEALQKELLDKQAATAAEGQGADAAPGADVAPAPDA